MSQQQITTRDDELGVRHEAAPPAKRGRALEITLWVVQILLAALFAFAGITKLVSADPAVAAGFNQIGLGQWFRYFTGAVELVGAIGLLVPRLSGLPPSDSSGSWWARSSPTCSSFRPRPWRLCRRPSASS